MVPPLLFYRIFVFDLVVFSTKAWLQKISIVDYISRIISSLNSSLVFIPALHPELYLKIFAIQGSNYLLNCANWKPLLPTLRSGNWKWEASPSSSESDRPDSASFSCYSWVLTMVKNLSFSLHHFQYFLCSLCCYLSLCSCHFHICPFWHWYSEMLGIPFIHISSTTCTYNNFYRGVYCLHLFRLLHLFPYYHILEQTTILWM